MTNYMVCFERNITKQNGELKLVLAAEKQHETLAQRMTLVSTFVELYKAMTFVSSDYNQ